MSVQPLPAFTVTLPYSGYYNICLLLAYDGCQRQPLDAVHSSLIIAVSATAEIHYYEGNGC